MMSAEPTKFSDWIGDHMVAHPDFWKRLGKLETRFLADDIAGTEITAPVYVCGLARAGTTAVLEALSKAQGVTSHRYSDFPWVFTPYWRNRVLALSVARDDAELLIVTENGFGKRTSLSEYPVKNQGTKGVLTAKLTEKKGGLAGALIVREHQELLFITENGMVQRTSAGEIRKSGRATQGVKVMNVKDGDRISAVALVVDSDDGAPGEEGEPDQAAGELPVDEAGAQTGTGEEENDGD